MSRQLPLALGLRQMPRLDDFVIGTNQVVIDALQRSLAERGERLLFIAGPRGSGRSHLLMGQCSAAQASGLQAAYLPLADHQTLAPAVLEGLEQLDLVAIDDVHAVAGDTVWEGALFALFNRCQQQATHLLFSADRGPAALPIRLPDLRSRLSWGLTLALQPLDDSGRLQLLQSLAARHALRMPTDVARYLLQRTSRHPSDLVETMARLDRASLAEQRRLTIPFVRQSLRLG